MQRLQDVSFLSLANVSVLASHTYVPGELRFESGYVSFLLLADMLRKLDVLVLLLVLLLSNSHTCVSRSNEVSRAYGICRRRQ